MSTMRSQSITLAIILLLCMDISSSMNCETLKIRCNSGEPNCYSGECGVIASHMSGINRLPLYITPSPTILVITPAPVQITTKSPNTGPNRLPTHPTTPTPKPTLTPSNYPTLTPSNHPTLTPTNHPTLTPSNHPTLTPSNYPTPTPSKQPTNRPIIITSPPTQKPSTLQTNAPTESQRCTLCQCDCSMCPAAHQCLITGPNCIWLTSVCSAISISLNTPAPSITRITNAPTTSLPTSDPTSTTHNMPSTTTTTTIIPISCATHYINGLYSEQVVIFEFIVQSVQSVQAVTFDACHSDLVPIIRLFEHDTNEILNECDLLHGCCGLHQDSGLVTDLSPGVYYFEFDYDIEDRKRFKTDIPIYHIHIDCEAVHMPTKTPVIDTVPTKTPVTTAQPTRFRTTTHSPTTNTLTTDCASCSCDCSKCTDAEQCLNSGPYCIWFSPACISIPVNPTHFTHNPATSPTPAPTPSPTPAPTSTPTTKPPSISPTTRAPTLEPTETCPQLGASCTSRYHKDVRCCNGNRQVGFARCYYTEYDEYGYKIGTCCVRANRPGCTKESDCCGTKRSCYDGYCLEKRETNYGDSGERGGIIILEDGDYAEWIDELQDDDGKVFGLSRASKIVGIIVVILCIMCNMVYWYFKYIRNRKHNEENGSDAETNSEDDDEGNSQ